MRQAVQLLMAASVAAVVAFAMTTVSCTPPTTTADAGDGGACGKDPLSTACACKVAKDCVPLHPEDQHKWLCTAGKRCQPLCTKNSDCTQFGADWVCDDALCQKPACGDDAQCGAGSCCIGGGCKPCLTPTDVASCAVLPEKALVHQGDTKDFTILATDASGSTVAYKGAVTWSVDQAGDASVSGSDITGTVTGGATTGAFSVKATIGSIDCTAASAINYAAADASQTRVVVADLGTHLPIAGATVVIGANTQTTDANGIATFDGADASKKTVSVFDNDYAYLTMIDVTGTDLIAYLKPPAQSGSFTGTMGPRDFDNLSDLKGNVHLAIYGGSIPGNLIDLQLSTLLGASVPTTIDLGSSSQTVSLPEGTVIGLGEQMFKQDYTVLAPVGKRTVWGLGGNAQFSAITTALGPALSGGSTSNLDVGGLLTSLLPLLGKLESGVVTGLDATADTPTAIGAKMKLDTPLRLRATATLPDLPTYQSAGATMHFDGAIVLGGALYSPQGLVPLGLTAGVDQLGGGTDPNDPTKQLPDGKIDPAEDGLNPGQVALRLAPLHGGLETSKYAGLALAASFSSLFTKAAPNTPKAPLVLSGIVTFPGDIPYSPTASTPISFGDHFLGVPEPTLVDRTFNLGTSVTGAAFHRIDIGGDATGEWTIYFPAGATPASFDIPTPPAGFADRLMATAQGSTSLPQVLVQSVELGNGTDSLDYNGVMNFTSDNMDDLTTRITTFSVREIVRPDPGN